MAHKRTERRQRWRDPLRFERRLCPESVLTLAFKRTLNGNISAVENEHGAWASHAKRTQKLAERVAVELGMSPDETRVVGYAALLHDIGKWGIPVSILDKPSKLNESEWENVRWHPEIGARMLASIEGLEQLRTAVAAHHERLDGRGYPAGMGGRDIPLEARLISVVDAYDAMTSDRPYKKALGHLQAVEQLDAGAGSQFDPAVVEATKAVLCDDGWIHAAREQASGSPPPFVSAYGRRRKEEKPRKSRIRA